MSLLEPVTIYYLEMRAPEELRPAVTPQIEPTLMRVEWPCPAFSRFLYTTVGQQWQWTDRLHWDEAHWMRYLNRTELETWVGYVQGAPAGYFELERQQEGNVQIVYFGLLPQFIGRGLGGYLLTRAVERAWQGDTHRVWVHTCSRDHPAALPNYQARGFRIYQEERVRPLPDAAVGQPAPGAGAA
ncbi:MAG: GNAT family N-acetyltransferase [Chloroherpetonaceae bacterium]|nr:GNAT family N-acetyltransferase [Chthonomonadaceae bacterium]MDW8206981.1 GNAT family N-acetyltransferase [Chloroherpetonaceae bacterium]